MCDRRNCFIFSSRNSRESILWNVSNAAALDESNIGRSAVWSYCAEVLEGGINMELGILTVALIVLASQIPGDYHVVFFR